MHPYTDANLNRFHNLGGDSRLQLHPRYSKRLRERVLQIASICRSCAIIIFFSRIPISALINIQRTVSIDDLWYPDAPDVAVLNYAANGNLRVVRTFLQLA